VLRVHDLKPAAGSKRRAKRVARGIGGRGGKTAGRGIKGQHARDTIKPGFEGGQLPLTQRVPKLKGFTNPFRVAYTPVNLEVLDRFDTEEIGPDLLVQAGLVHKHALVKVLGRGRITKSVTVKAHAFSSSAKDAIETAGGRAEVLPPPFGRGRPPSKGNALTNR